MHGGGWHMGGMWLWWVVAGLFLMVVVAFLVRALQGGPPKSAPPESPEEILKRRYARGEIELEEYQRKLAKLQQ